MKAILRFACLAGLISSLPCAAQTFGDLHAPAEARPFAPSGLLADPDIAKWLLTLPSDAALEPPAPEAPVEAQLLDPAPIGGEVYHFAAAAPVAAEAPATAALSPQMFAAHPIGRQAYSESYSMRLRAEPSRTVAEIAAPKAARPALQGRSVAKRPVRRAHRARPAAAIVAHAARPRLGCSRCGLQTGRSAAVPARDWRLQGEGSADLPAPRGPAGLVTIVPAF
jgi:hypothetical protein